MKLRNISLVLFVLCAFFGSAHSLPGQYSQGRVSGVVLDVNDARVVGAKITFMRDPNIHEVFTIDDGEFEVELPAGAYRFTVSANGFCKFDRERLIVTSGKTELINVHLEVVTGHNGNPCKCATSGRQD
jgi:hypothetical protein